MSETQTERFGIDTRDERFPDTGETVTVHYRLSPKSDAKTLRGEVKTTYNHNKFLMELADGRRMIVTARCNHSDAKIYEHGVGERVGRPLCLEA